MNNSLILALRTSFLFFLCLLSTSLTGQVRQQKPRIRDFGIEIGILPIGPLNAITDVPGVKVGQTTIIRGENVRTGVTAVLPHGENLFQEKTPGAVFIGNAFGKLIGSTQVNELGEIETPILLTSTLSAPKVADAVISYMLSIPGNESVKSVNPLVGETNDGYLNDIRARSVTEQDVLTAITTAKEGIFPLGSVGAGTGTIAFGFKGGIGTASRRISIQQREYIVGILVQSNFGGVLNIAGIPLAKELPQNYLRSYLGDTPRFDRPAPGPQTVDGSIMIVIATNAPLEHRNLNRLAARAMMGLGRTGSSGSNGSGDYVIAFSTASDVRIKAGESFHESKLLIGNEAMSSLFEAVIEGTEEAIYDSLFQAETMTGNGHTVQALPVDSTIQILKKHGIPAASKPN